jgi:hypothetical protein
MQACHQEADLIRNMGRSAVPEIDFEDIVQNSEPDLSHLDDQTLTVEIQAV